MIPFRPFRTAALAAAVSLVLACPTMARDLGSFDINAAQRPKAAARADGPRNVDALGRATFTWVQQDLAASLKSSDPVAAARAHLHQLLGPRAKGGGGDVVDTLQDALTETQFGGAQLVRFTPRVDGIPVFHEDLALLMDSDQRLVAMRGPLPRETAAQAKSLPAFALDAAAAVAVALGGHDFDAGVATRLRAQPKRADEYTWFDLAPGTRSKSGALAGEAQRARRVWFRTRQGLQPAWYVETQVADAPSAAVDYHAFVISAVDGSVLFRMNQTADAVHTYRVWAEDGPDFVPLPGPAGRASAPDPDGLPSNNTAPLQPNVLRTLDNVPFSRAATDPWLPAGAVEPTGNNVEAFADRAEPSGFGAGDLRPTATAPGTFDYPFDPALAPDATANQTHAATMHLFFTVNWLHDVWYDHGFAEVDGNAQADNYGRGGRGGDVLRARAQHHAVSNNATMSTPADGAPPLMRMGLTSGNPKRDFTLDTATIAHEWGHYISNRLVADSSGLASQHAGGMGEGWGDFLAQMTIVKDEDRAKPGNDQFQGAYGGFYVGHTYYGLRRYPYSTDLTKSPLTLGHIATGIGLPAGVPRDTGPVDNAEVHNQGEIWASALWEGYAGLLRDRSRLTFGEAQSRMKNYVVGGMKLTPVNPTMVEGRDAILATALANGASEDFAILVAGFAKRGMGAGAYIPDRYSTNMEGTTDSFSTGADIEFRSASFGVATGCDADAQLDPGETADLTVTVGNAGFTPLSGATLRITASEPSVSFPQGSTVDLGSIALFASKTIKVPVRLGAGAATNAPLSFILTPNAPGIQSPPGLIGTHTTFVNFDESARSATVEEFDGSVAGWDYKRDPVGEGFATWIGGSEGAARYLRGQDTATESVNWAQTPPMATGAGPLSVTLRHRFSFEAGDNDGSPFYDGGVVQASIDGGSTWTDVTPPQSAPLSDCCGNPMVGKAAFVARNLGYPGFVETTIDLGTGFANRSNFRLRFGVATDASVTRNGWDIDRVTINGLSDTPFASVVPQASSCAAANHKTLQGPMSGTYYSPARSGEGVLIDFGQVGTTPVVFFSWYTYEGGQQQWLVGSSPFSTTSTAIALDLIETDGANFGSQFRPQDVVNTPWGTAALTFPSCDSLQLTYRKLDGQTGTLTMQRGLARLESGQCSTLHGGLSGTYYSTARSGEGVLVDFGKAGADTVQFFTWYTYDGGQQQWLVGSKRFSPTDPTISVDLISTRGAQFGAGFRPQDVVNTPWGKVTQRFVNCDTLELSYEKTGGETGTLTLNRGLQRLGDGVCR